MDSRYQFGATLAVWISYAAILITLFLVLLFGQADLGTFQTLAPVFLFVMFLTSVTAYATRAIWRAGGSAASLAGGARAAEADQMGGKAKRRQAERLQNLIERLDEDEIIELESLLMTRGDDELLDSRRPR